MEADLNYASPVKGRFAEAIVEALFRGSGMDIRRSGYEWIRPLLPVHDQRFNADLNDALVGMPDFYLLLPRCDGEKGVEREYIEVKFCIDGQLAQRDWDEVLTLREKNPWRPTLILIQLAPRKTEGDPCRMRVYRHPYTMSQHCIKTSESVLTQGRWNINPEVYEACERLIDVYPMIEQALFPKPSTTTDNSSESGT